MNGYSTIFCDGHSLSVGSAQAARLRKAGLTVPHPGSGEDGITGGDWTLAEGVSWGAVYEQIAADEDAVTARLYYQDAKP